MRLLALCAPALLMIWGIAPAVAAAIEPLPAPVLEIRSLLGNSKLDPALDAADRATAALPQDPRAWFWAARAYGLQAQKANLLTKAKWAGRTRDAYLKAVELDPAFVEAHFDLMQYYLLAPGFLGGGRDKADVTAATIAKLDLVWGKLAAGSLALQDENPELAERLLREAVELAPDNERGYQALSAQLQRKERWSDAKRLWQSLLERQPDNSLAHYSIARNAILAGEDFEDGLLHIDRFIALDVVPENYSMGAAHWRRGLLLEKLDRRQDAIAALQIAAADPLTKELAQPDLDRMKKGG